MTPDFACCCDNLTTVVVDSNNPKYTTLDGVLYSKDMKTLICCGGGKSGAFNIPESVTTISNSAVDGCTKLTSISIPNTVTSIGTWAFSNCKNVTAFKIPDNNNYTTIEQGVFNNCGTTELIIPKNIKAIKSRNLQNPRIKKVTFADTSRQWKMKLCSGGVTSDVAPTSVFSVTDTTKNAEYFVNCKFYEWTKQ